MNRTDIFVFGSNLAGRHGKGAALYAKKYKGAKYGQGEGLQGYSYALPTKDGKLDVLSLDVISRHIGTFFEVARCNPQFLFHLTPVGCGLAGYKKHQILEVITSFDIPENVVFTREWFQNYKETEVYK